MPCVEDWLTDPLSVAEGIFTEAGKPDHERVREFFTNRLQNKEALERVPSLNDVPSHLLKSKSLVRFRCMVQDMFDPEFYLAAYEVVNKADNSSNLRCGMYQDMVHCGENFELRLESPRNVTKERQTFYCVPIPGETEWAKKTFARNVTSGLQSPALQPKNAGIKRSLDEEMDEGTATVQHGKLSFNQRLGATSSGILSIGRNDQTQTPSNTPNALMNVNPKNTGQKYGFFLFCPL